MRLLLPKPQTDWQRWQVALADVTSQISVVDPWLFDAVDKASEFPVWQQLSSFTGIICVSARSATELLSALHRQQLPLPSQAIWLCNGPGSAKPLVAAGLSVRYPQSDNRASAALELIDNAHLKDQSWLLVKGEGGLNAFAEGLDRASARVTELTLYRRRLNQQGLVALKAQSAQADVLLLSSTTLAEGLWQQDADYWQSWPGIWLLSSERLVKWAMSKHLSRYHCSYGAALKPVRQAFSVLNLAN